MLTVISSPAASRTLTDTLAGQSMAAAPNAHQAQLVHHDLPPDVYVRGKALTIIARHLIISVYVFLTTTFGVGLVQKLLAVRTFQAMWIDGTRWSYKCENG